MHGRLSTLHARVEAAFAEHGPLARAIPGYAPREGQRAMALAVADCLRTGGRLICESGTGTGKTLAYLVPALIAGARTVVSTGTRHLQEQLYHRDLPMAMAALGVSPSTALLKGRANYLCRHRLRRVGAEGDDHELAAIRSWAARTVDGDISGLAVVGEESPSWRRVTSTAESCLGAECDDWDGCHVVRARRAALGADLTVVNHHLFLADSRLKDEGFGELLPGADLVVLDEAHQLPETAAQFFGTAVGSGRVAQLADDARAAAPLDRGTARAADSLRASLAAFASHVPREPGRWAWEAVAGGAGLDDALGRLHQDLIALESALAGLEHPEAVTRACQQRAARLVAETEQVLATPDEGARVRWLESTRRGFVVHASPLEVGAEFAARLGASAGAVVLSSATLAVSGRVDAFARRLGLEDAEARCWESPFDYPRLARCLVPTELPRPDAPDHTERLLAAVRPVLEATGGGAFLLFTSHQALRRAAARMRDGPFAPVLVQGDAPRATLLERFRASGNGLLLGTASFWEGVDVPGFALRCVVIDRLPFASPGDPVVAARLRALAARGEDPFRDYQLPGAVLALKQGIGRLIRGPDDHGVVVIGDTRLLERGYGRVFLASLPPIPVTRSVDEVLAFLAEVMPAPDLAERVAR